MKLQKTINWIMGVRFEKVEEKCGYARANLMDQFCFDRNCNGYPGSEGCFRYTTLSHLEDFYKQFGQSESVIEKIVEVRK